MLANQGSMGQMVNHDLKDMSQAALLYRFSERLFLARSNRAYFSMLNCTLPVQVYLLPAIMPVHLLKLHVVRGLLTSLLYSSTKGLPT